MKEGYMLAYTANAPQIAERRSAPSAMLFIVAGHVAVIAAVMSARMDLPRRILAGPTVVTTIPVPPPPDPIPTPANPTQPNAGPTIDHPIPVQPLPGPTFPIDLGPVMPNPGPIGGTGINLPPNPQPIPFADPVRLGPQLLTPVSELKPPYPASKLLTEEEAVLKLRLAIDENGRVTAVEPVGRVDGVFLSAARRHLIGHWRYRPASVDGRAIPSSMVVTLRFQLDG
jgi:periplasmic protein TonB